MKKDFTIKRKTFQFSDDEVREAASNIESSALDRVKFYAKVQDKAYPARQLVMEMVRRKGETMPDIITYQAIGILRALGYEITEL